MRATIANITNEDVIHCFQNGLTVKHVYRDFGRNRTKTAMELRDMMQRWADQEDEENERFPKSNNDNRFNKGQRNYSGSSRKRKPEDQVAAVERNLRGKKSVNQLHK
jgi:hypothetical protein